MIEVADVLADLAEVRGLPCDRVRYRHSDGLVVVYPSTGDPEVLPLRDAKRLTAARRAARAAATVEGGRSYIQLAESS